MLKKNKNSFIAGILWVMLSQVIIKVLGLVYKIYLTNKEGFGDAGNAINSSGFQIYALLLTISSIGVPSAISKLVSERLAIGDTKGAHRVFKIGFMLFASLGFVGTLTLLFGAKYISTVWLQIPEAESTLISLSPSIFFVAIASVIRGYFNGRERLDVTAKSQTLEQLFKSVITIILVELIFINMGGNTTLMATGANLATTLATFLGFVYLYMYYNTQKRQIWNDVTSSKSYIKERMSIIIKNIVYIAFPITLTAIMSAINKNVDSITVVRCLKNFLSEDMAKAQYGILSGKIDTLTTLPLSFNIAIATALVPSIAFAKARKDDGGIKRKISFSLLVTILIGLPCAVRNVYFCKSYIKFIISKCTRR